MPAGTWKVLRLGRTTTGEGCHPAPPGAEGLECDKLDREGVDAHFDGFVSRVLTNAGPATGRSLGRVFIDSYEVGDQDWSPSFREEFQKRRGYDPVPWLATLRTNYVVGDAGMTRRFQQDWKRTIAELFADNYYGYMAERVHQYPGLKLGLEPYYGPFDTLAVGTRGDEVMAEFWQEPATWGWDTLKPVASSAHTAGIHIVGAESFTGQPQNAKWQQDPYALKAVGDRAFCAGINQLILHTSAHQPWTNAYPGMTMGFWGTQFGRTQTWWNQASGWLDYLARCQYLLQQGTFIADLCFLHPGGGPASDEHSRRVRRRRMQRGIVSEIHDGGGRPVGVAFGDELSRAGFAGPQHHVAGGGPQNSRAGECGRDRGGAQTGLVAEPAGLSGL